jgi:hypothetical protein
MVRQALVFFAMLCSMSLGFFSSSKILHPEEYWWEIIIQLKSKGTYSLDVDKSSYLGKYAYSIQWSGCMEQDGQDFILYYENSELIEWKPQEKKRESGASEVKITKEFSEKPSFVFNYILTKKENIHFDFLIHGFRVPQLGYNSRHYLHLPASKENSQCPTDIVYDLHIYKGSNQIYFSKDDLLDESSKKDFHWSWKRHSTTGRGGDSSYLSHSYDVDVEISILRRTKREDDTSHKYYAAVCGSHGCKFESS